jgi:hypothetical protein
MVKCIQTTSLFSNMIVVIIKVKHRPDMVVHECNLATQETESRRILVPGQPRQKVSEDPPSHLNK